jgi:hypothetical protein
LEERRKNKRFPIPFNVDVIPSQNTNRYVSGEIRDFSPEGFSFEAKKIDLEINNSVKARFQIYPGSDFINVLGRIVWKIRFGVDCQVGIEINEIDIGSSHDLGFPFNMWKDKIKNK